MRVKISANPPLPPVRAWFPLALPSVQSTPTVSSFKSLLCTSLPAFSGVSPSSLCLSIDGFELLDNSELTVVRDGDLICVDVLDARTQDGTARGLHATQKRLEAATSHKRKRRESETKSTTSPSASESESESETSESDSTSDSDDSSRPGTPSLRKAEPPKIHASERALIQPKPHVVHPYVEFSADLVFWSTTTSTSTSFVPPGYGKSQTRLRNLRRRLKRMHEREGGAVSEDGPASGANAQVEGITPAVSDAGDAYSGLLSLSLRNKNKAKNFKSLLGRPLAPKIIFGDAECPPTTSVQALPRLIPPSSRSSLPPNLFVTSIDVERGLQRKKKQRKTRIECDENISLDYGNEVDTATEMDIDRLEAIVDKNWGTLERLTSAEQITGGMTVGYKALGINAVTYTPEQCLTVGRVVSCDRESVIVRPLRAQVSFGGPVESEEHVHTWHEILTGDWRLASSLGTASA